MRSPRAWASRRRPGFTLIEILMVVSIVLLLTTIAVAFLPKIQEKQRATQGAVQLQSWLRTAKQWALRDGAPRGIRLGTAGTNLVTQLQYIEQPDDWVPAVGGQLALWATAAGSLPNISLFQTGGPLGLSLPNTTLDFTGGYGPAATNGWPVQVGDYLEINQPGPLYLITAIDPVNQQLSLNGPKTSGIFPLSILSATTNFRVVRQPRPRLGESPLLMPLNVAIDLTTNAAYGNSLPSSGNIDILFGPSGTLVGWTGAADRIHLWVRDTSEDSVSGSSTMFNGEQNLISVSVRTGMISAHPVDTKVSGNSYQNPYSFTQDGRASGL